MSENTQGQYRLLHTYDIIITPSMSEPYVQKYWAERLNETVKAYESTLKDLLRGVGTLLKIIEDWAYGTDPGPVLMENYEQARKYIVDTLGTAVKLRDEISSIVRLHFPGKAVFTKPLPQFQVPSVEELPPRIKLKEKLNELATKIRNYLIVVNEKMQDLTLMAKQLKADRDALYEKYKANLLALLKQYRDAIAKQDAAAAAAIIQKIKALEADYKRDLTKLVINYVRKHRDTIDDIAMYLGKIHDMLSEYMNVVQPNDIKVYKALLEQIYRAKLTLEKVEQLGE